MIEELKIKIVEPPKSTIFPLKRKVLVEKLFTGDKLEHYLRTILIPGEHLWLIDEKSLNIVRYTISFSSDYVMRNFARGTDYGKIFLFDERGERNYISINVEYYLERLNTNVPLYVNGIYTSSSKFLCSSEKNVLITLKNYIPFLNKQIQENLNKRNTAEDKALGKKARLKKLQKFHKRLVKYLEENP